MKCTSVEIHPFNSSDVAVLSFKDPKSLNPYNVNAILGLDADQIVKQRYRGSGGSQLRDLGLLNRVVTLQIELNPDFAASETFSDLRDALYKLIWTSRLGDVQLQFKDGTGIVAQISGTVTKFESPQFSQKQMVQITIECEEPMLKAPTPISVYVGYFASRHFDLTDEISNAPHGIKMVFTIRQNVAKLLVGSPATDLPNGISLELNPVSIGGFLTGDVVHLSSEFNDKYLYIHRGSVDIPIFDAIEVDSVWPLAFPGVTPFFIKDKDLPLQDVAHITSLSYYPTYWGV